MALAFVSTGVHITDRHRMFFRPDLESTLQPMNSSSRTRSPRRRREVPAGCGPSQISYGFGQAHGADAPGANPWHNPRAMSMPLSGGTRPMRRRREARSSPSTYSMDRNVWPSAVPMSYTRHTLGCDTCRASRTRSARKAARRKSRGSCLGCCWIFRTGGSLPPA